MKAYGIAALMIVGGLTAFAACSEESTDGGGATTTTTTPTVTGGTGGTEVTGGTGGAAVTGGTGGTGTGGTGGAGVSVTIEVTQGATTESVDLGTVTSFTCGTGSCVAVDDIILAAFPSATISAITADFVASDGYNPVSSPNCSSLVPVAGSDLELGRVTIPNRNLVWDDSLSFPGCLDVDDLAEIIISE
jgi:hypothetical protein